MNNEQAYRPRSNLFIGAAPKALLLLLAFLSIPMSLVSAEAVRYAGLCYMGNYADLPALYKYSWQAADPTGQLYQPLERIYYDFFRQNNKFANFVLDLEGKAQSTCSMAMAINREDVAFESFGTKTKAVYTLGCSLFLLDFTDMTVLQTYPLRASFIELYDGKPTDSQLVAVFRDLLTRSIPEQIRINTNKIGLRRANTLTMRVSEASVSEAALPYLTLYKDNLTAYTSMLARHLTSGLAFNLGITMLPYSRDAANQKMSLAFTDATMQNFTIPTASYDVSLEVSKFVKKPYQETAFERVDLYGAYVNVKIYDAELGTVYWQQEVKYGAAKQTTTGQSIEDDFYNYHEVLLGNIFTQVPDSIRGDKNLMKGVVKRCASY